MTDNQTKISISQGGLEAVENLLLAAKLSGIGVTIEPDSLGWKVGYILPSGGGELAAAYDLETAVRAAERPFNELAEWLRGRRDEAHEERARAEPETEGEAKAQDSVTAVDDVTVVSEAGPEDEVTVVTDGDAEADITAEGTAGDEGNAEDEANHGPGEDQDS
jgi:hypothetical protein